MNKIYKAKDISQALKMISKSYSFLLYSCSQHSDLTNGWNVELNDHLICQTVATARGELLIESGRTAAVYGRGDFYTYNTALLSLQLHKYFWMRLSSYIFFVFFFLSFYVLLSNLQTKVIPIKEILIVST